MKSAEPEAVRQEPLLSKEEQTQRKVEELLETQWATERNLKAYLKKDHKLDWQKIDKRFFGSEPRRMQTGFECGLDVESVLGDNQHKARGEHQAVPFLMKGVLGAAGDRSLRVLLVNNNLKYRKNLSEKMKNMRRGKTAGLLCMSLGDCSKGRLLTGATAPLDIVSGLDLFERWGPDPMSALQQVVMPEPTISLTQGDTNEAKNEITSLKDSFQECGLNKQDRPEENPLLDLVLNCKKQENGTVNNAMRIQGVKMDVDRYLLLDEQISLELAQKQLFFSKAFWELNKQQTIPGEGPEQPHEYTLEAERHYLQMEVLKVKAALSDFNLSGESWQETPSAGNEMHQLSRELLLKELIQHWLVDGYRDKRLEFAQAYSRPRELRTDGLAGKGEGKLLKKVECESVCSVCFRDNHTEANKLIYCSRDR
jgi:hypothetical protein